MTKVYADIDIIILPDQILIAQICISPRNNTKFSKISFSPKFSDLDEVGEVVNRTMQISQVMTRNELAIEKSTDFI